MMNGDADLLTPVPTDGIRSAAQAAPLEPKG